LLLVSPLAALCILAAIVSALYGVVDSQFFASAYYLVRPIVYIMFGCLIASRIGSFKRLLVVITTAGLLVTLYYLARFMIIGVPQDLSSNRYLLRTLVGEAGNLSSYSIATAGLLLWLGRNNSTLMRMGVLGIIVLLGLIAAVLSQSRTAAFTIPVVLIAAFGFIPWHRASRFLVPAFLLILFVFTTPVLTEIFGVSAVDALSARVPGTIRELISIDSFSQEETNLYWRGYEGYQVYTFVTANSWSLLWGTGLHSKVPLITIMQLAGNTYSAIPIFHSGFSFALVRGGLLGLGLFILQYALLLVPIGDFLTRKGLRNSGRGFMNLAYGVAITSAIAVPSTVGLFHFSELGASPNILLGLAAGAWFATTNITERPRPNLRAPVPQR
jgi:hypothetical protein